MKDLRAVLGMRYLENLDDEETWFTCNCECPEWINLSVETAYNMMLAVQDGVRGNLVDFDGTSALLGRWFATNGPLGNLLGCCKCGSSGIPIDRIRSAMQDSFDEIDSKIPWKEVSETIRCSFLAMLLVIN